MAGLLRVRLHSAEQLAARDIWGTSDPYCVLSVGASSARSHTIGRTLDPTWDEDFTLFVRSAVASTHLSCTDCKKAHAIPVRPGLA